MLKNMVLIYHKIPAQKNSPVQARAGREGKGSGEKEFPPRPSGKPRRPALLGAEPNKKISFP